MKFVINTFLVIISTAVAILLVEGAIRIGTSYSHPEQMFPKSLTATLDDFLSSGKSCSYRHMVYPHPYLIFVMNKGQKCSVRANNDGFFTKEFPETNPPESFDILVMGGSVANMLSFGDGSDLVRILEAHVDKKGRPVKIYASATGVWKQPQLLYSYLLFQNRFDAVISLEAYNEAFTMRHPDKKQYCPNHFFTALGYFPDVTTSSLKTFIEYLHERYEDHAFLQNSYAFTFFYSSMRTLTERVIKRKALGSQAMDMFKAPIEKVDLETYLRFLSNLNAVTRAHNQKLAIFIQPVPGLLKPLTETEKTYLLPEAFYQYYRWFTDTMVARKDLPVYSIMDVFADVKDEIYIDPIHPRIDSYTGPGYVMIAERISLILRKEWGLRQVKTRK